MGDIVERRCCRCGNKYKYEKVPSYILFCPRCKRFDYFEPNYTDNGIIPCRIYLGDEIIGEMTSENDNKYNVVCKEYRVNECIYGSTNPYLDAGDILKQIIGNIYGSMDYRTGELTLHNEIFHKDYTFKQFKKSALYSGQNAERVFTLEGKYKIDNWEFYVSLFFRQGILNMISLCCNTHEISFDDEPKRKELHDSILAEYGLSDDEEFVWGSVRSVYDRKSNVSSINIIYDYDEDELPMFYNSDISDNAMDNRSDEKRSLSKASIENISESIKEPLKTYLTKVLLEENKTYYNTLKTNPENINTFRKEYLRFLEALNLKDDRNPEVDLFFRFLQKNNLTISKLVAKKQGQEYLFSQLKYALELEDTYYNQYLIPGFQDYVRENVKPDEQDIELNDFKRINGLSGVLTDLNYFMSFFIKQWQKFIDYLYKTIEQVCNNICVRVPFPIAVNKEKEFLKKFIENYYNVEHPELYYDGTNDNPYKNLFIYCLISYLDDFYLSKFPEISARTFLEDYYLCVDSDINEGLDLKSYELSDIPDFSDRAFPDLAPFMNVIPKNIYTLKDVAEVYATVLNDNKEKVYKRLEKYFSDTGIFKPSKESREYEFKDMVYPIAAHMFFKKKNRTYAPEDRSLLSDNQVFDHIYYPLFRAKILEQENVIEAYSEYRKFILEEFKRAFKRVDDSYLIELINMVIGKSSMRLSMRIIGIEDNLTDSI